MTEREVKLRLVEAAASLPAVRMGSDHMEQARRVTEIVELWYTDCIGLVPPIRQRGTRAK